MDFSPGESGNIKAIDRSSIHRICSGQVVLTLATAVKELVENSIDAGATNIEVKLKEYGSELVEVSDNGGGVKSCDYQSLTLKHHTSKIGDFSDLPNVSTFGFRGEALSSLCALSKMSVITCHQDSNVGERLDYDHDGLILKQTPTARQVGTTVILENLFSTLPVRHKDFHKNLKKEFGKMIQLLTAYCLISTKKRITCVNNTAKGKKTFLLSTNGDPTIRGNISCVYGTKQLHNLMEFVQKAASDNVLEEFNITSTQTNDTYKIEGFVSPSTHGEGRSTSDRQFFFINGRPCDLPKVAKVINDVYHSFNRHQYPFVCLNIELLKDNVDVNVTPDKRQIFISSEKALLAIIKTSIVAMYECQPSTLKHCTIDFPKTCPGLGNPSSTPPDREISQDRTPMLSRLKRSCDDSSESEATPHAFKNPRLSEGFAHYDQKEEKDLSLSLNNVDDCLDNGDAMDSNHSSSFDQARTISNESFDVATKQPKNDSVHHVNFTVTMPFKESAGTNRTVKKDSVLSQSSLLKNVSLFSRESRKSYSFGSNSSLDVHNKTPVSVPKNLRKKQMLLTSPRKSDIDFIIQQHEQDLKCPFDENQNQSTLDTASMASHSTTQEKTEVMEDNAMENSPENLTSRDDPIIIDEIQKKKRRYTPIDFHIDNIKDTSQSRIATNSSCSAENYRKFRSKINEKDAELELRKEISKDMFAKMEIIGQFNLGFIIAKFKEDLFIVDQHATDEKYNFEVLQRDTVLETQKLLNPQTLELTADSEATLLDNLSIFEKNGFKFTVSEDAKPGQRVQLISSPVSQNWSFGKEDIDELIFMLSDNSAKMCRPSRVCQMFASRACRKSVMIGTSLSHQTMKKLVHHMGEIEQPWNCPHGRPTMRHLFNMNLLQ